MSNEQSVEDLLTKLERERQAADRQYNDALTALDRAVRAAVDLPAPPPTYDDSQVERLNQGWNVLPGGAPAFDRSIKGRLRGFVWRFLAPTFEAQNRFNGALVDHVNRNTRQQLDAPRAVAALIESARRELESLARFQWLLLQFLQTITAYVDTRDRKAGGDELRAQVALMQQRLLGLERQLTRAAAGTPDSGPSDRSAAVPSMKYPGFEDRFRGTSQEIRSRLESYLPLFASARDVLDIGCGRGEFLQLFRERGITARGIDANQAMVDLCLERGLAAEQADALAYLERQPDQSLGGLVAIQVVEHLEPAYLLQLLETAYHKLRPGAPLVLETINVASWMAFFECYLRDLTHVRPLHPDTLRYVVQASGFSSVNVEYLHQVGEGDRLERLEVPAGEGGAVAAMAAAINAHADLLNQRLFSAMDYAIVASR